MRSSAGARPWDVLLLGGASAVGKSTVSRLLARDLGVVVAQIDDVHTAVRAMTTPEQLPDLHYWHTSPEAASMSPEQMVDLHIAVSRLLMPAVRAVVAQHIEDDSPVVLEGDYLVPEIMDPHPEWGSVALDRVRAVFLHEPDTEQVARNLLSREPDEGDQTGRARVTQVFGRWLRDECIGRSALSVDVRPFSSLPERILTAIA